MVVSGVALGYCSNVDVEGIRARQATRQRAGEGDMSTPVSPSPGNARMSLTVMRGLLERNLVDRAVAVAESRWPGSGPMVTLAHEWARLSPLERRERLAAIGPEDLARLRGLGQLHPDLARVLDDLEARGVIPPTVENQVPVDPDATMTPEEALVDVLLDVAEEKVVEAIDEGQLDPEALVREVQSQYVSERIANPLPQVDMPDLDLGLPTQEEQDQQETERRARLIAETESILDRVRDRLDHSASRLTSITSSPFGATEPAVTTVSSADGAGQEVVAPSADRMLDLRVQLGRAIVFDPDPAVGLPDLPTLAAVASEMGLGLVELRTDLGRSAFYGGLVRRGRDIVPEAGVFPRAVSGANLVVVRGRLYPKLVERLNEGYCDIPGTRATVLVHPKCRVVLLPA
jgi:hypothetical protein